MPRFTCGGNRGRVPGCNVTVSGPAQYCSPAHEPGPVQKGQSRLDHWPAGEGEIVRKPHERAKDAVRGDGCMIIPAAFLAGLAALGAIGAALSHFVA